MPSKLWVWMSLTGEGLWRTARGTSPGGFDYDVRLESYNQD